MAYFDNASTTFPKPEQVYDYMDAFYRRCGVNVGRGNYSLEESAGNIVEDTRNCIKKLLHAPAKQVIFTPTATIALNMIIQGLVTDEKKNVYISPFEHNAVTRVLHNLQDNGKINTSILAVDDKLSYEFDVIRNDFHKNKPDIVIVSHASNVFGLISPIEEIFRVAKEFGAITVADMSQTAGLIDCNVGLNIFDFAVFAGHKTLYGPTGISGFVMNPDIKLRPVLFGGTGYESANQNMPESIPEKYEMGTLNILGIAGLNAALKWIDDEGIDRIRSVECSNRKKLIEILSKYDCIKMIGIFDDKDYVGIVSCLLDGISSDSAGSVFSEQNISVRTGLQCAPSTHKFLGTYPAGTVRFSVGYFTNNDEFDELDNVLNYINENI